MLKPAPSQWRDPIKRGMKGHDVAAWQAVLRLEERPTDWAHHWPLEVDGDFGEQTEKATWAYQARRQLKPDGVVGPKTRSFIDPALFIDPAPLPPTGLPPITEIPAKYWRWANRTEVDTIILHAAEDGEFVSSAEAIGAYFKLGPPKPASSHLGVDCDSICRYVKDEHIAFHAPPNEWSIGIEQAGYSRQTREEWLDPYGRSMLRLVARLVAYEAKKWNIPLVWLTPEELRGGTRGLATHNDVRLAFHQTTHTDPGPFYPKDVVIGWAIEAQEAFG